MEARPRILFIDDEEGMCRMVDAVLSDEGYDVTVNIRADEALSAYKPGDYDLVITDVRMPVMSGLEVLARVRGQEPAPPVIVATAYATLETSIDALRKGAYDMLTKPFEPEELLHRIRNALARNSLIAENRELREKLEGRSEIIGEAPGLLKVLERAERVAERDIPVLINGESGTGKELVARAIHKRSARRDGPFVAINCGALPSSLLEAELFGSRKGAFTGADEERAGLILTAEGGTLFLDEVGNLPENVQRVLLRFLQEREFYKVGDDTPTKVDVRVVAATNVDLEEAVKKGSFREDLYYRLAVVTLLMPPLRERVEDIMLLAAHFMREDNLRFGTLLKGFTAKAKEALLSYPWPGNVRQLKNVIEGSMALEQGEYLTIESLAQVMPLPKEGGAGSSLKDYATALAGFEREYFSRLLSEAGGSVEDAAKRADVNLATFYRKMKKHGLKR
ncbi:MAG: sigma-54-dependent Fis family transcriptional regulator [Deltaproteobacteria bacterium]|nr:MAG: sigma-54-dependent Fis family transcriptional regulator [Deltaproteobacteria bacterium]